MKKAKRTHWDRNTESVDDYLKAIYSIGGDDADESVAPNWPLA